MPLTYTSTYTTGATRARYRRCPASIIRYYLVPELAKPRCGHSPGCVELGRRGTTRIVGGRDHHIADYTRPINSALPISACRCPCHRFFVRHTGQRVSNMVPWLAGDGRICQHPYATIWQTPTGSERDEMPMFAWVKSHDYLIRFSKTSLVLPEVLRLFIYEVVSRAIGDDSVAKSERRLSDSILFPPSPRKVPLNQSLAFCHASNFVAVAGIGSPWGIDRPGVAALSC